VSTGHLVSLTGRVEWGLVLVSEVDEDIARLKHLDRLVGEGGRTAELRVVKGVSGKPKPNQQPNQCASVKRRRRVGKTGLMGKRGAPNR
jgi:hypothetical protein